MFCMAPFWVIYVRSFCVTIYPFIPQLEIKESSKGTGKVQISTYGLRVPCFPLESILLALNQTHVDYFSLDVEGLELDILKTIPFNRIQIDTLSVEYIHGKGGKKAYTEYMETKGYVTYKEIRHTNRIIDLYVNDLIFVRKELVDALV